MEGSRGGIKDDGMGDMEEHYRFTHPSIQQQLFTMHPGPGSMRGNKDRVNRIDKIHMAPTEWCFSLLLFWIWRFFLLFSPFIIKCSIDIII